MKPILLEGFSLRPPQEGDEESLPIHANNPNIAKFLSDQFPQPYTMNDARKWIDSIRKMKNLPTQFAIVIANQAVGGIGFNLQQDIYYRSAELGYWLGEDYWGRGIISQAIPAVVHYAFDNFDICRIFALVFDENLASAKALEKTGFQLEGRFKMAATKNGKTLDERVYAIVREERAS